VNHILDNGGMKPATGDERQLHDRPIAVVNLDRRYLSRETGPGGGSSHIDHAKSDCGKEEQSSRQQHLLTEADPQYGEGKGCTERSPAP
jgi:hypothetical protein